MAAPAQSQQPQGDHSLAALWICALFILLGAAIAYFFRDQIIGVLLTIKYGELLVLNLFTTHYAALTKVLAEVSPAQVSWGQMWQILNQVGDSIRYVFIVILLVMIVVLVFAHPSLRFKKTHSMKSLLLQEKFNWPQIMPVTTIDLVKEPLEKGPWAMAMTPMQFAKHYRLLYEEREEGKIHIGKQREKINVGLLRSQAYQVFAVQTGATWPGLEKLPIHVKAMFAIFAARANRDQESAKRLLDQLAISSVHGHPNFSGVEEVVKKYQNTASIKKVIDRHVYILTVMASMLELAREDGVVASAEFLWLKLVDRPLWYMLNSIGRQTPPSEVAGAFGHWIAEKKLGRRIYVPMVEEAVKALEISLQETVYVPDEGR